SDVIYMVEGTSFMGLGGPNLVKGATGQVVDAETLGGASTHTQLSAVAHYRAANDEDCIDRIRDYVARLPLRPSATRVADSVPPSRDPTGLYEILPDDHRLSYDMRQVLDAIVDAGSFDEFQPGIAGDLR